MSTTTARLLALPFMLAAFGLRVLDTFWLTPLTWRIDAWQPALAAWLTALMGALGLPLAGYLLLTRRARRRAATWRIEPGNPSGTGPAPGPAMDSTSGPTAPVPGPPPPAPGPAAPPMPGPAAPPMPGPATAPMPGPAAALMPGSAAVPPPGSARARSAQPGPEPARFTAPAAPRWTGPWAILMGWLAGAGLVTERVPGGDRMRLADFAPALPISVAVVGGVLLLATVLVVGDRPRLTLDPEALTLQGYLGRLRVTWDELVPGGPPPLPAGRRPDGLTIYRMHGGVATPVRLPVGRLHVEPAFLAHTIRWYTEHPERREGIGTEAGLAALRSG